MTKKYYSNVTRSGNRILVREIRDGKRRKFRTEYKPTLYVPTKKQSNLHTTEGIPVEPVQPGTMNDCYAFLRQYKDVANFRVYGNANYEYAYINEEYSDNIDYSLSDLVIVNIDIEVESKNGYSEAKDANNEIQAITIKSSTDGVFHVFACQPFDDDAYNLEHTDTIVVYHQCNDELELLEQFLDLWETLEPDIVTGWNIRMYDIPYLVNRISILMSADHALRLSPWNIVKESTVNIYNKPEIVYEVAGLAILDYLLIYRKNVLEPRESYRLDYIAEVELKEHKVDYGEYGSLAVLYEKDFRKFIEYNIHDVRLVDRIDNKRKLIELQLIVAYHAKVNYDDVISPVRTWDALICNHLLGKGVVVPQKSHEDKNEQFVGAFVMKPVPGMYEWIVAEDVQGLYPELMRTLNIGIETRLEKKDLTPEMRNYQAFNKQNLMVTDSDGKLNVDPSAILEGVTDEFIEHLIEQDVSVAANGVFYRREPRSFYSVMIGELFANRLEYKKKAKEAKKMIELITIEMKARNMEMSN